MEGAAIAKAAVGGKEDSEKARVRGGVSLGSEALKEGVARSLPGANP